MGLDDSKTSVVLHCFENDHDIFVRKMWPQFYKKKKKKKIRFEATNRWIAERMKCFGGKLFFIALGSF